MKLLITGGCGFLGSNLASHAITQGYDVIVFDNLSRLGTYDNLNWLKSFGTFEFVHGDIRNKNDVTRLIERIKPDAIFHLAGQVAMTTSLDNPYMDFEVNIGGSINVLEAVRLHCPETAIFYSSTNKVYGDLEQFSYRETATRYECIEHPNGFSESVGLDFHSPYGCSKGAADQYMLDYARLFGLNTTVFRHSSMYGGRQFATYDQGWVGWFCQKALDAKNSDSARFTISGSGKQVRDVLHADDMISLYFSSLKNKEKVRGRAFNVGGGIDNSLSLLELFKLLECIIKCEMNFEHLSVRASDQRVFVADYSYLKSITGWKPTISKHEGVHRMIDWLSQQ
ncbi:CDP-paratose 2-epimerase [Vibrio cholerae]|uniref:GDP-mannose 4,6-dehydratase n=1 Tax=Vibrio cholerae TaxID=666 RepID=UPI0006E6D4F1|nr:GDP-mannose 4,6-dehydratase [Vibrio cholerae]EHY0935658.1 GDP-mannose 4,6-dehydratase [Vibrio cholerae]EJL6596469.1 GDP-mannose 4,6-dehydratase [Vibrio cholerae]EJL6615414.1 GDP-mannose 4,6-dehydratase [Vibrio cholerae]KQA51772.1 CDP-paratose 2-epimerase [Vibrio cholerae]KQA62352.1 CDP-paratose 2-epimerase [Vibrio cholerae]